MPIRAQPTWRVTRGSGAPSAATGGTRVADRAGSTAAAVVTTTPVARAMAIV